MLNKIFLSSLFVSLLAVPTLAEDSSFLDTKSRKIITNRACKRHASRQYTDREEWNYIWDLVTNNAKLQPHLQIESSMDETVVKYARSENELADEINTRKIKEETILIIESVTRKCR